MRDSFASSLFAKSFCAAAALALSTALAAAAEIRVVSVGALQSALKPLGADFAKQGGDQVNYTFTNPANLKKVLSEGQYDVIIAAASIRLRPRMSGTEIKGGPVLTTSRTSLPGGTRVPAAGSCRISAPLGMVLLDCATRCTCRPIRSPIVAAEATLRCKSGITTSCG